jgi:hypothetical protein
MNYFWLFIISQCICTCGFAVGSIQNEKLYVSKDGIYLEDDSIWAIVEGVTIPVKSVHVDSKGIYVQPQRTQEGYWYCANCGATNSDARLRCWWCGELKEWAFQ